MTTVINFSGDAAYSHFSGDVIHIHDYVVKVLKNGHFNVCNLENPVCIGNFKQKQKPITRCSAELPRGLLECFDGFSLANNHIFDCGTEGFLQTRRYLERKRKKFFGAGLDQDEARRPLRVDINGTALVLWGITRFESAGRRRPGTAADTIKLYRNEIQREKDGGGFVVIFAHWGREYVDLPTPDDRHLAKSLIDCGADCIVGTHPHVPQGAEIHNGKYIFYSLGNFIFSDAIACSVAYDWEDPRMKLGYIVQLCIEDDLSYAPSVIPYRTENGSINVLADAELDYFKDHFLNISMQTSDDSIHVREFFRAAVDIRRQSLRMIKKQVAKHGVLSLLQQARRLRLQDLRIAFYPSLERKFTILARDNFLSRAYSVFVHKFLTFSLIGVIVVLTTMLTLGFLLGILKLPLFPTWWIVYLSSISLSLFLNNKLIFKGAITIKKTVLFFLCYLSSMFLGIYLLNFFRMNTELPNWLLGYLVLPFTLTYNFFVVSRILQKGGGRINIDKMNDLIGSLIKDQPHVSKG